MATKSHEGKTQDRVKALVGAAPIPGDQKVMGRIIQDTLASRRRDRDDSCVVRE